MTPSARCASRSVRTSELVEAGWRPLWVVDFPMFEWDEDAEALGRDASSRSPRRAMTIPRPSRPIPVRRIAKAYDMVLNGTEIGGGSVRIHRQDMQSAVFELLGIGAEEAQRKFGFLLDALKFGARRTAASRSASTGSSC